VVSLRTWVRPNSTLQNRLVRCSTFNRNGETPLMNMKKLEFVRREKVVRGERKRKRKRGKTEFGK
jgi:hypothetical protein